MGKVVHYLRDVTSNPVPVLQGKVDGKCPVEVCGAICCQTDFLTNIDGPCSQLDDHKECSLAKGAHGDLMKPFWCVTWPRDQQDIDEFNAHFTDGRKCELWYG